MTGQIDNLRKERNIVQKGVATKMKAKEACEEGIYINIYRCIYIYTYVYVQCI
jgi:hypothetical protein